jgi:hypothetical protein
MIVTREMIDKAKAGVFCRPNGVWGNSETSGGLYKTDKEAIIAALVWYQLGNKLTYANEYTIKTVEEEMEKEYVSYLCRRGRGKWKKK